MKLLLYLFLVLTISVVRTEGSSSPAKFRPAIPVSRSSTCNAKCRSGKGGCPSTCKYKTCSFRTTYYPTYKQRWCLVRYCSYYRRYGKRRCRHRFTWMRNPGKYKVIRCKNFKMKSKKPKNKNTPGYKCIVARVTYGDYGGYASAGYDDTGDY